MCIVIDSDRTRKGGKLNATKLRVRREFVKSGCIAWVTAGREIENYVRDALFEQAVRSVHPRVQKVVGWDRYAQVTRVKFAKKEERIDKIKVAHEIASSPADLGVLDLADRIKEITEFVERANGLNI